MTMRSKLRFLVWGLGIWAGAWAAPEPADVAAFARSIAHGRDAAEAFERSQRYLRAWLRAAEPTSGLILRNLFDSPYWNGRDSAADNYPFMVLSAYFTDREAFEGPLRRMLETEQRVTRREGWLRLTDDYNLTGTPGLRHSTAQAERIIFNSAEYVKYGLLALTEWLGPSPWSDRMFALIDDSFALASVETPFGRVPLAGRDKQVGVEVSGDHLQALARLYWMSGRQERYLEWGIRLADLHLLPEGKHHPTRDFTVLRLRDHGCEIVSGLCEFYATVALAGRLPGGERWARKQAEYRPHLHEMLDRILAVGRNEHGLLFNEINPVSGKVTDHRISDSWGYVFDGYFTVFLIDGTAAYREAALRPLGALEEHYRGFNWEPRNDPRLPRGSHDGYADAIESALNLSHRAATDPRVVSALRWVETEVREMWSRQQADGFIEKWHGDGNFARTSLMYALWKTQGVTVQPWRADVRVGEVRDGERLLVTIAADRAWDGVMVFDRPRHAEGLRLPLDWPRINQFPEWFTVADGTGWELRAVPSARGEPKTAAELRSGVPVSLPAGATRRWVLTRS